MIGSVISLGGQIKVSKSCPGRILLLRSLTLLKRLQEWKEAPVDCMALSLHYIQMYYSHEIERGKQGLGEYTLHPQFSSVLDLQPPLFSESIYHPQSIIDCIKGNYTHCENEMNSNATLSQVSSHKCNVSET